MIACGLRSPEADTIDRPGDEVNDAAAIFAVLNSLDESELDGTEIEVIRAARIAFRGRLTALGLKEVDLFEHIAKRVETEDWKGLGLPMPED